MTLFEKIAIYFEYPFVRYAFVVGVLIALCSALLGVLLVLKRFSFIGDGLSHVAFGAMAVAGIIGLTNDMIVVLPVTVLCAIILLCSSQNAKIKGDASVAMISVSSLAVGYFLMNVLPSSSNVSGDVCTSLFGSTSILTLAKSDVIISIALSVLVIVAFALYYNKIFAVTFDETFVLATGSNIKIYNIVMAIITAVVIVVAMNLVGSLLISALVIFPALSAMRIFKNFKSVLICSACISVVCTLIGLLISILYGTPVGATIVIMDLICFGIFCAVGALKGGKKA